MLGACIELIEEGTTTLGTCPIGDVAMSLLFTLGILAATALIFGVYIYQALAWKTIAQKLKHKKPWLAWIPFAASAMRLQLGGFSWKWIFLVFIPLLGWLPLLIMVIIAEWRIYEKRKYPGWFSLSYFLPEIGILIHFIILGYVAWKDRKKPLFK